MRISEKTTQNSERLFRQTRLGIEPGTFRLPVLSAEPLRHWRGAEGRRADSISVHLWSLRVLLSSTQIRLYAQQTQTETSLSVLLIFMRFMLIQITQV